MGWFKLKGQTPKAILLADRNYEACGGLAHLERKGWKYLIRIRDKDRAAAKIDQGIGTCKPQGTGKRP